MQLSWGVDLARFQLSLPEECPLARQVLSPWSPLPEARLWRSFQLEEGSPDSIQRVEYEAIGSLYEHPELFVLHGSYLWKGDQTLLILGAPLAGKSTLSLRLWHDQGWNLGGDDCIVTRPQSAKALPGPRRLSLRWCSRELIGDELWQRLPAVSGPKGLLVHPQALAPLPKSARTVTHILLLSPEFEREELDSAQALLALLPFTSVMQKGDLGYALKACSGLAQSARTFRMGRSPLRQMLQQVQEMLD